MPRPPSRSWARVDENPDRKKCSGCQTDKPPSDFPVNAARYDGLSNYCVECTYERAGAHRRQKRLDLLNLLGGKCVRCGFDDWRALHVDHVNGDGAEHRRNGPVSNYELIRLVRATPERFQILCANCNAIKKVENAEHRSPTSYTRKKLEQRVIRPRKPTKKAESYSKARTEASEARQAALLALVEERRPLWRSPTVLPPGNSWSRWYPKCLGCETTERKHASDGLCWKCDKLVKGLNRRVSVYATPPPA